MFVQIHMLQSLPPGNLNRDENGLPKRCVFGGVTRGRISSQSLKRHIRWSDTFRNLQESASGELAIRTRDLPHLVGNVLASAFASEEVEQIQAALLKTFEKESGSKKEASKNKTPQLVFFPPSFADDIAALIGQAKDKTPKDYKLFLNESDKKKLAKNPIAVQIADQSKRPTIDIALFGRMTTSPLVVDVEATCQVAHAISTHEMLPESDYFTALDDLADSAGASYIGSKDDRTHFSAGVFYKYFNIDTTTLSDADHSPNLTPEETAGILSAFLEAAMTSNPTGKQNAFAAFGAPEFVLVEFSGVKRPINYANAFLQPVYAGMDTNLMVASVEALCSYVDSIATAWSPQDTKRLLFAFGNAATANTLLRSPHDSSSNDRELLAQVQQTFQHLCNGTKT